MRLLADSTPLRESPSYRRLWIGTSLSQIGSQMTLFAVALQVYRITHSSAAVGAIGLASALPMIAFGLFGGSIADAVDRRRLVLYATIGQALVSVAFAAQAFAGSREVWLLYVLEIAIGLLSAVNVPARRTFMPRLLRRELVPSAAALTMLAMHTSTTLGPLLGGAIAAVGGLKLCYLIDAVSFGAALYGVGRLPPMPPLGPVNRPGVRAVGAGLSFIASSRVLTAALISDLTATVPAMPVALFPAINAQRFGGGAGTLGLLTAGLGIGGLIGAGLSGPVRRIGRPGRAMLLTIAVWGLGIAGFGLAHELALAVGALIVAGVADVLSVVFRTSIVQLATPDEFRGRVSAAEYVVGGACPQLGNFRAGLVASYTSTGVSAVSGGLCAVAGAGLIRLLLPAFARYRTDRPSEEAAPVSPA